MRDLYMKAFKLEATACLTEISFAEWARRFRALEETAQAELMKGDPLTRVSSFNLFQSYYEKLQNLIWAYNQLSSEPLPKVKVVFSPEVAEDLRRKAIAPPIKKEEKK